MRLNTALVAGFAAATSAFLVPPNIPDEIKDTRFTPGPPEGFREFIHHVLEQRTTTVDLTCPECLFPTETTTDGMTELSWHRGVENVIHLEFDTHDHTFNVNGHPLLPLEKAQHAQSTVIKAHQIRKDTNEVGADVPLNFAMEVMPPIPSPHREGVSLIPVEFTVLGLNGTPVKVNTISLKLIQPPNKELVLVHAEEIPFEETPGAGECEGARSVSICRLKAIISSRIKTMIEATTGVAGQVHGWVKEKAKSCGKAKGKGFPGFWQYSHKDGKPRHSHHWDHHRHHRHHRYSRLGRMLRQTFRFFVIPALLGIIGGLTASAIGMLFGRLIVFLWFRAYRNGRQGPLRVEREVAVEEEKHELLGEQEALPAYEDTPIYEDVVGTDVEAAVVPPVDEKH